MIIWVEVMMPWPLSERGSANETVPSRSTSIRIRFAVGRVAQRVEQVVDLRRLRGGRDLCRRRRPAENRLAGELCGDHQGRRGDEVAEESASAGGTA
jgi:hypothetical protein